MTTVPDTQVLPARLSVAERAGVLGDNAHRICRLDRP